MNSCVKPLSRKSAILRLLVPLVIIVALIAYSCTTMLANDVSPVWQHYLAIGGFVMILLAMIKSLTAARILLGIYSLLAIVNIVSLSYGIFSWGFAIGPLPIPLGQPRGWLVLIVYGILNFDLLCEDYFTYKERKKLQNR